MRTAMKVAAALGAVAVVVGAPVAFVVRGAGAPGRADSAELWWERLRRAPEPVLVPPSRASSVNAGGKPVEVVRAKVEVLETRAVPVRSPVVGISEWRDLVAVATFDGGAFLVDREGTAQAVQGVAAVNAVDFDSAGNLYIASDDGAYLLSRGGHLRVVASGPFSAVSERLGVAWFAGRNTLLRVHGKDVRRWRAEQGIRIEQATSVNPCGSSVCLGGADGVMKLRIDEAGRVHPEPLDDGALPTRFVTAVDGDLTVWAGTSDGGLVHFGEPPLTPADGLPDGRINPRAMEAVGDAVFAGTPSGLMVVWGRRATLAPVGSVGALMLSNNGGTWIGLSGEVVRVGVEFPSEQPALAQSQSRNP